MNNNKMQTFNIIIENMIMAIVKTVMIVESKKNQHWFVQLISNWKYYFKLLMIQIRCKVRNCRRLCKIKKDIAY